jgi:hypothetical protein
MKWRKTKLNRFRVLVYFVVEFCLFHYSIIPSPPNDKVETEFFEGTLARLLAFLFGFGELAVEGSQADAQ